MKRLAVLIVAALAVLTVAACDVQDPTTGDWCTEVQALNNADHCHLTPTTGNANHQYIVTTDGAVLENLLIDGCLRIDAQRVKVHNVMIEARSDAGYSPCTLSGQTGALVMPTGRTFNFGSGPSDSTFSVDGSGTIIDQVFVRQHSTNLSTYGVAGSGYYMRNNTKVFGGSTVATCEGSCTIEDSRIFDKSSSPGAAFVYRGGRGNVILRHSAFNAGSAGSTAASVMFTAEFPNTGPITIQGSIMAGTSSYRSFLGPIVSGQTTTQWDSYAGPYFNVDSSYFVDPSGSGPLGFNVQGLPNLRLWSGNKACLPNVDCNDPANQTGIGAPGPRP